MWRVDPQTYLALQKAQTQEDKIKQCFFTPFNVSLGFVKMGGIIRRKDRVFICREMMRRIGSTYCRLASLFGLGILTSADMVLTGGWTSKIISIYKYSSSQRIYLPTTVCQVFCYYWSSDFDHQTLLLCDNRDTKTSANTPALKQFDETNSKMIKSTQIARLDGMGSMAYK